MACLIDAGSPDVNGKFEIKEDGTYRLQVRDLFGGTRTDPNNIYRLIVRQVTPDFSLAAWAIHMTLRNGDRARFPNRWRCGRAIRVRLRSPCSAVMALMARSTSPWKICRPE